MLTSKPHHALFPPSRSQTGALARTLLVLVLSACSSPQPGPDKSAAGAVLGAGWGAGTGAIVGHQVGYSGEGAAVGAGVGAVSGALQGFGYDLVEDSHARLSDQLSGLELQAAVNARELAGMQDRLDRAAASGSAGLYQVFFDADETSLKPGAVANLEIIADSLRGDPHAALINVVGHSDDSGKPEYSERVSEARARSVAAYLVARGLSQDQIVVKSFGSKRPIATNSTPAGRQLNRRVDIYISKER